jgi:hypothetical protein
MCLSLGAGWTATSPYPAHTVSYKCGVNPSSAAEASTDIPESTLSLSSETGAANLSFSLVEVLRAKGYPRCAGGRHTSESGTWYTLWTGGEEDPFFEISHDRPGWSGVLMTIQEGLASREHSAELDEELANAAGAVEEHVLMKIKGKDFLAKWFAPLDAAGRTGFSNLVSAMSITPKGGRPPRASDTSAVNASLLTTPSEAAQLGPSEIKALIDLREACIRDARKRSRQKGLKLMQQAVKLVQESIRQGQPVPISELADCLKNARCAYHLGYHGYRDYVDPPRTRA